MKHRKQREIQVEIDENGVIQVEAIGYEGRACLQATRAVEEALGITSSNSKRTAKPEMKRKRTTRRLAKA